MTAHNDLDRELNAFLREGPDELPDTSFNAVRDRTEQTRQRVVIGPWRTPTMNRIVGFGLAAVAVVAAVVIGTQLFGSPGGNVGSGATPSPEPTATPVSSVAEPSSTPLGIFLPEGPFVLQAPEGGPAITVTIPAPGWTGEETEGVLVRNNGGEPPDGAAIIGPFYGDLYVFGHPCQWSTTMPDSPATTVDEMVAALQAQASRDASAPEDITVDGHAGKSVILHVPDDADFADCDDEKFASWAGGGDDPENGPSRYHQGPGQIDEVWILDVDGELIAVDAMYGAETSAEHIAELHAILGSMTFE